MMSALTQLRDEAQRLLTTYQEHKHSDDLALRRKVHVDLDCFLMQHREVAAMLLVSGLTTEIDQLRKDLKLDYEPPKSTIWSKLRWRKQRHQRHLEG